jgi:hypothetical protein
MFDHPQENKSYSLIDRQFFLRSFTAFFERYFGVSQGSLS